MCVCVCDLCIIVGDILLISEQTLDKKWFVAVNQRTGRQGVAPVGLINHGEYHEWNSASHKSPVCTVYTQLCCICP